MRRSEWRRRRPRTSAAAAKKSASPPRGAAPREEEEEEIEQPKPPPSSRPSSSAGGAAPPSAPTTGEHAPTLEDVDEHLAPDGQPLPPWPRQPSTHVLLMSLHTRPEPGEPHSESFMHAGPASATPLHVPIEPSAELHVAPVGQPLPPDPRQPG